MQTFLPYPGFAETARVLDVRRLGKQRVEALQVLRGLIVPGYGWRHHPAVRMWAGYEEALARYGLEMCRQWRAGGRADTCAATIRADLRTATGRARPRSQNALAEAGALPPWLGDPAFHRSHQSALVRKDPAHYARRFPGVPDDLPYVWPTSDALSLEPWLPLHQPSERTSVARSKEGARLARRCVGGSRCHEVGSVSGGGSWRG